MMAVPPIRTRSGDDGALHAKAEVEGGLGSGRFEVLAWASELILKRVPPHFPATVPSVKPTPAVADALVQYNLQVWRYKL